MQTTPLCLQEGTAAKIIELLSRYTDQIEIIIDDDVVDAYNQHYRKMHPKSYKDAIASPLHPSINEWAIAKRMAANTMKQKWKDLIVWLVNNKGYGNLQIDDCIVIFETYYSINRRRDADNVVPKFILDGLTEAGLIVDDDSKHIRLLPLRCEYTSNYRRSVITILYNKEK